MQQNLKSLAKILSPFFPGNKRFFPDNNIWTEIQKKEEVFYKNKNFSAIYFLPERRQESLEHPESENGFSNLEKIYI